MGNQKEKAIFQRKHVRAPLRSVCLYVDGEHVFKAKIINVSEGGILLSELPHIPDINSLPMMISIPLYPKLSTLSLEQLNSLTTEELPRKVLRVKSRIVRNFEGHSNVEKLFLKYIACEFYSKSEDFGRAITDYVENFAKNTIYLLSLFESLGSRGEQVEVLRQVAHLLGYDKKMKIPLLRAKVLHDYQSLESL